VRTDLDNLMDFAVRVAERAGEVTLEHFGRAAVEFKGDGSEVTAADRAAEEYVRSALIEAFPDDGILGEEDEEAPSRSGRRWIVDPIDGTRSFSVGIPLYGVLLGLQHGDDALLGVCHFPALAQTVVAARGGGAWFNGRSARVSDCDSLASARVVTSGLEYWRDWATEAGNDGFHTLVERCRYARTWGDCYGYMLVATGRADILADPAVGAAWDYLPVLPIMIEAGARFTTLTGSPVGAWTTALAASERLHAAARGCWSADVADDREFQTPAVLARR
jgi:histidinol-phosphatase